MSGPVRRAMVMAAGKGTRMRPLTDAKPKPLVDVSGKPLIDWALDLLGAAGVIEAVVNHHHFGEQLKSHLSKRRETPSVIFSDESDLLLETGGGVVRALPLLGDDPFFVLNADGIWLDDGDPGESLRQLADHFDPRAMDACLLLVPPDKAMGYKGKGDFSIDESGRLARLSDTPGNPVGFAYCGIQVASPTLFADAPEGPFSTNVLWDRAITEGRLFGIRHQGPWLHVGTPKARDDAEAFLRHR